MQTKSQSKGIMSFDALFSMVPILLMMLFVIQVIIFIGNNITVKMEQQDLLDKLVSVADYSVKSGLAKQSDTIRYPNWIDKEITDSYIDDLRMKTSLHELYISLNEPRENYEICIYRLVVVGNEKKISRLFVCGD